MPEQKGYNIIISYFSYAVYFCCMSVFLLCCLSSYLQLIITKYKAPLLNAFILMKLLIFSFRFEILGVRSLANASRARQFNPLTPLGWGGYRFLKQIWQPWSVVVGRAWSCVVMRGRSCVVVVRGRVCVIDHSWSGIVVRGRSCGHAVLPASRPALP